MKKLSIPALCATLIFLLGACSALPTRLERDYGNSVRLSRSNQILNPEAAKDLEPVTGLDGKAAQTNMEKYRKAFEEPAKSPLYIFQMGGSSK